jgi:hypothetical protein
MPESTSKNLPDPRPPFMVLLGLNPPYAAEDVKAAYLDKAKSAHPDRGGSAAEFDALHQAFEQAKQFLEFRSDRRGWIAKAMDSYLLAEELVQRLEALGAEVTTNANDWLKRSFGDFAQLTETVTAIRLSNAPAEPLLRELKASAKLLLGLQTLELPGCQLSDAEVIHLKPLGQLRHLNLRNTPVTNDALILVDWLPVLDTLETEGTNIGWFANWRVQRMLTKRRENKPLGPIL